MSIRQQRRDQVHTLNAIATKFHARFLIALDKAVADLKLSNETSRWQHLGKDKLLSLLTLRALTIRHKLPLIEILTVLLQSRPAGSKFLALNQITGSWATQTIETYVAERYPQRQNLRTWKSQSQVQQLTSTQRGVLKPQGFSGTRLADRYREAIKQARQRKASSPKSGELLIGAKPYRDSPW